MHFNSSFSGICLGKTICRALDSVPLWYAFFRCCKLKHRLLGPLGICVQRVVNSGPTDVMKATRALFQELWCPILWQFRKKTITAGGFALICSGQNKLINIEVVNWTLLVFGFTFKDSFCQVVQYTNGIFVLLLLFFFFTQIQVELHYFTVKANIYLPLTTLCAFLDFSNI